MRYINLLGSTGSIGTQTLNVIKQSDGELAVGALAAGKNVTLLAKQVREFEPKLVCCADEESYRALKDELPDYKGKIVFGDDGLVQAAVYDEADMTLTAVVGMMGILPTVKALEAGKDIALANKETLVTAGHIIMPLSKSNNCKIYPVDSEHSAIFQCLQGEASDTVEKLIITASGGPFRGYTKEQLKNVTLEQALNHPNWSMGKKITIDSATLVNKGLEVIEARWLFDIPVERIEAVIHPQSIIHSMVEFNDGAIKAQLGVPDMTLPIQYALYRATRNQALSDRLDITSVSRLDFYKPDTDVFKGLSFAYDSITKGGNMPVVFNAANEFAVAEFLSGNITFTGIYELIEEAMSLIPFTKDPSLEQIDETQKAVYELLNKKVRG